MKKFAHFLELVIFASRWLLAPLYIGLIGALGLLLWRYGSPLPHSVAAKGAASTVAMSRMRTPRRG